jgi:hypothetical protein
MQMLSFPSFNMHTFWLFNLAATHGPLFGNQWLALLAILAGVAVFLLLVAAAGRWLAATHPDTPPKPAPVAPPPATAPEPSTPASADPSFANLSPEVQLVIAAAVMYTLGKNARITGMKESNPNVETLMVQWAMEGRREIYTSHRLR